MRSAVVITLMLLAGGALAHAQRGINWLNDPQEAVALAQRTQLPIMVYVLAGSDERDDDLENAQRRALSDPQVLAQARRFVPLRLSRSRHRDILSQFHLPESANMQISFVEPGGAALDTLSPSGVGQADSLAQKMALVFDLYRQRLFDREMRPVLEKPDSESAEVLKVLQRIRELTIKQADASVAALLERQNAEPAVLNAAYDTLAHLSTKIAVEKLLERSAAGDDRAARALAECTPEAAELMLDSLISDEGTLRVDVYQAVAKICRIRSTKPVKWWEKANERLQQRELERVRELVREAAQRWKAANEYR